MIFSFIADNYGRKMALTLAWGMTTVGSLLLAVYYIIYVSVQWISQWLP